MSIPALEKIRADHKAEIDIDTRPLHSDPETKHSDSPYVIGNNHYGDSDGKLIYLKTSICPGLPEDIYGYQRENDQFPDESTTNQFFSDQQFEAYRELGFRLAEKIFRRKEPSDLGAVFVGPETESLNQVPPRATDTTATAESATREIG